MFHQKNRTIDGKNDYGNNWNNFFLERYKNTVKTRVKAHTRAGKIKNVRRAHGCAGARAK